MVSSNAPSDDTETTKRLQLLVAAFDEFYQYGNGNRADGTGTTVQAISSHPIPLYLLVQAIQLFGDGTANSRKMIASMILGCINLQHSSRFYYEKDDIVVNLRTRQLYKITQGIGGADTQIKGKMLTQSQFATPARWRRLWNRWRSQVDKPVMETAVNPIDNEEKVLAYHDIRLFYDYSKISTVIPSFGLDKEVYEAIKNQIQTANKTQFDTDDFKVQEDATLADLKNETTDRKHTDHHKKALIARIMAASDSIEAHNTISRLVYMSMGFILRATRRTPLAFAGGAGEGEAVGVAANGLGDHWELISQWFLGHPYIGTAVVVLAALMYMAGSDRIERDQFKSDLLAGNLYNALTQDNEWLKSLPGLASSNLPHIYEPLPTNVDIWNKLTSMAFPSDPQWSYIQQWMKDPAMQPLQTLWRVPESIELTGVATDWKSAFLYAVFYESPGGPDTFASETLNLAVIIDHRQKLITGLSEHKQVMLDAVNTFVEMADPEKIQMKKAVNGKFQHTLNTLMTGGTDAEAYLQESTMTDEQVVLYLNWIHKGRLLIGLRQDPPMPIGSSVVQYFGRGMSGAESSTVAIQKLYQTTLRLVCAHVGLGYRIAENRLHLDLDQENAIPALDRLHAMKLVPDTIDYEGLLHDVATDRRAPVKQTTWEHLIQWNASLARKRALTDFSTVYVIVGRAFQHIISTYLDTVVTMQNEYIVTCFGVGTQADMRSMFMGGAGTDDEEKTEDPAPAPAPAPESEGLAAMFKQMLGPESPDPSPPPQGLAPPPSLPEPSTPPPAPPEPVTTTATTDGRAGSLDTYYIQFSTIPITTHTNNTATMCRAVAQFNHFKIIEQAIAQKLDTTPEAQSWIWQRFPTIPPEFARATTLDLQKYAARHMPYPTGESRTMPTLMQLDNEYRFLCPYNFSVNVNGLTNDPRDLASKVLSKVSFIDLFAYRDFWIDTELLGPALRKYTEGKKAKIISQNGATSTQLHQYLNASMMHTAPDNLPLIYRHDVRTLISDMESTFLTASGETIQFQFKFRPEFAKELKKQERQSASLFQKTPNVAHAVGPDGRPLTLTQTAHLLLARVIRTSIVGSYDRKIIKTDFKVNQFNPTIPLSGGATLAAFQRPVIAQVLNPIPVDQYVDGVQDSNLKRLLSMKLYQLFAELAENLTTVEPETLLYILPNYRQGRKGFEQNKQRKIDLITAYNADGKAKDAIDLITRVAGLPRLGATKTAQDMDALKIQDLPKDTVDKHAITPAMAKRIATLRLKEIAVRDDPPNEKVRQRAVRRLQALEDGEAAQFYASPSTLEPYILPGKENLWQKELFHWKDAVTKQPLFKRECVGTIFQRNRYCVWRPVSKAEMASQSSVASNPAVAKAAKAAKATKTNATAATSVTIGHAQTGHGVRHDAKGQLRPEYQSKEQATKDADRRLKADAERLALAVQDNNLRTQKPEFMDGNRGKGAVRMFTARDAAGNEIFTVLPHNFIANIMILIYAALIIYAGSRGAVAYQSLYLVQTEDRTTKLEAVYPARGAATFFFGFGFGTIVAFLASIVEFFNYWRFRYVFGLVLMALPIIILGSIGMSNLGSESNLLNQALGQMEDVCGNTVAASGDAASDEAIDIAAGESDTVEETPGYWSTLFGTEYVDELTEARESLAVSDMLFIGLGIGVLATGIMIGIPGGPFHTDRNEMAITKMRDGEKFEHAHRSHIKTHWLIYPALLTIAVIGAGASSIAVATQGGSAIKRTTAEVEEDEDGDHTGVSDSVAWPAIQGSIIAMVIALLAFGALVLIGYFRQQRALNSDSGRVIQRQLAMNHDAKKRAAVAATAATAATKNRYGYGAHTVQRR